MILHLPSTFLQKIPFYTPYIDYLISSSSNNDDLINFSSLQVDLYKNDENKIDPFNDDIEIENENKMKIEKPIFETKLGKKKRGKKAKRINKKVHGAGDRDNVISKIQTHFLNFVINFLNDCVNKFFKNKRINFKKFNHADKSNSTYEHVNTLKNCTINNLLELLKISDKYTRFDEDFNKKNKEKLIQNSWFQKLFEMKYTTLFSYYFNDNKPLNEMILFEKKIILSSKKKSFYDLTEKNKEYKNEFMELAKRFFNYDEEETGEE
jgi:hypothetical protein